MCDAKTSLATPFIKKSGTGKKEHGQLCQQFLINIIDPTPIAHACLVVPRRLRPKACADSAPEHDNRGLAWLTRACHLELRPWFDERTSIL